MTNIGLAIIVMVAICNLVMAVKLHDEGLSYAASLHYALGGTLLGALYALAT